ncbi:MAG: hypothetical protein KA368_24105 [Acidobacteria bacterium]|nr:hypothetical protein [Acidobacteriota bacterium]
MNIVKQIIAFRSPQHDADLPNEWRFAVAGQLEFSWPIVNPSGERYVDGAHEGMGEIRTITKAQANGDKRQVLINCAIYTAKQIMPKYGETVTDATEVKIR